MWCHFDGLTVVCDDHSHHTWLDCQGRSNWWTASLVRDESLASTISRCLFTGRRKRVNSAAKEPELNPDLVQFFFIDFKLHLINAEFRALLQLDLSDTRYLDVRNSNPRNIQVVDQALSWSHPTIFESWWWTWGTSINVQANTRQEPWSERGLSFAAAYQLKDNTCVCFNSFCALGPKIDTSGGLVFAARQTRMKKGAKNLDRFKSLRFVHSRLPTFFPTQTSLNISIGCRFQQQKNSRGMWQEFISIYHSSLKIPRWHLRNLALQSTSSSLNCIQLLQMFPVSDFNFVVAGIATFAATVGYACTRQLGATLYDLLFARLGW